MSRLLGVALIYVAMLLGVSIIACCLLLAPKRFGNLMHDGLNLFPEVHRGDWGKMLLLRLLGVGLLMFAIRLVLRVVHLAG